MPDPNPATMRRGGSARRRRLAGAKEKTMLKRQTLALTREEWRLVLVALKRFDSPAHKTLVARIAAMKIMQGDAT